ncbi:sugar transferase [Cloacibacterium normanense]|uniref:sugar transferase n=1 Tax=Cloacibacterium normanense TaxID=237258 RepID=UPI000853F06B|nr:sugar transferase [Cloacibacterium normanense]AZI70774.1 sugar transferase [Cloacibacterium normanense]SDO56630.1 Sugar transferase involved in LPS biosynthesis (colanic, teichoic acid) [Cloacibacterium normanense]
MYVNFVKPLLDFVLSVIGILLSSPIFIIIFIALLISNRGHVFFLQNRPGKNEKLFKIIKFRTMNNKKDIHGILLPDAQRLTFLGRFVRKTSMDEIPQLLNVLLGDMSLIGPRPLLPEYLPLYNEVQKKRHNVKPGITGWAQINGRNAVEWDKKFEFDVWYVENLSFLLDLQIMFLTLKKVLKLEGVNREGEATNIAFKGNE